MITLVQSAEPAARRPAKARRLSRPKRLVAVRRALASNNPLAEVRALMPGEDACNEAQQVVVYAFACLLEVGSAGLSILFERFKPAELRKIASALSAIRADGTRNDFDQLDRALEAALDRGMSRIDASEWLGAQSETRQVDRRSDAHVAEIERTLLVFCRAHLADLAG